MSSLIRTSMQTVKGKITWVLNDFALIPCALGTEITSARSTFAGAEWSVQVYPGGSKESVLSAVEFTAYGKAIEVAVAAGTAHPPVPTPAIPQIPALSIFLICHSEKPLRARFQLRLIVGETPVICLAESEVRPLGNLGWNRYIGRAQLLEQIAKAPGSNGALVVEVDVTVVGALTTTLAASSSSLASLPGAAIFGGPSLLRSPSLSSPSTASSSGLDVVGGGRHLAATPGGSHALCALDRVLSTGRLRYSASCPVRSLCCALLL